jgi:hypothetical protein
MISQQLSGFAYIVNLRRAVRSLWFAGGGEAAFERALTKKFSMSVNA